MHKLIEFLKLNNVSQQRISSILGITYQAFWKKCKLNQFDITDIKIIADELNLTGTQILDIFFDLKVDK